MANPQKEQGYTAIANEILEHLVSLHLLGSEWDLVVWVIRQTYGRQKKEDWISLSQFEKTTGLSRKTVIKGLKNLIIKGVLVKAVPLGYKLQKDWEKWGSKGRLTSKHAFTTLVEAAPPDASGGRSTHKRKINKRNITKETMGVLKNAPRNEVNDLIQFFRETINPHLKFNNKTQREAAAELIKAYGLERVKASLIFLENKRKTDKYLPLITTPYELLVKWAKIKQHLTIKKPKVWKSSPLLPSLPEGNTK